MSILTFINTDIIGINTTCLITIRQCIKLIMTRDNKRRLAQIIKNKERDYLEL